MGVMLRNEARSFNESICTTWGQRSMSPSWQVAHLDILSEEIWIPAQMYSGDWYYWANRRCSKVEDRDGLNENGYWLSISPSFAHLSLEMYDSCPDWYFNLLNGWKNERFQFWIKIVASHNIFKMTARTEQVGRTVLLHRAPISGKTEITDVLQNRMCVLLIVKDESTSFQNSNLVVDRNGLLVISHCPI